MQRNNNPERDSTESCCCQHRSVFLGIVLILAGLITMPIAAIDDDKKLALIALIETLLGATLASCGMLCARAEGRALRTNFTQTLLTAQHQQIPSFEIEDDAPDKQLENNT